MPDPVMVDPAPKPEATPPVATPPVATPPVEPAKAVEPASTAEPAKAEPAAAEPLLGEPKTEEKPKVEEKPKADDKSILESVEPPAEPEPFKYEPFKLPEDVSLGETEQGEFTKILGAHKVPQEAAQSLIDLYVKEVQKLPELQREMWNRTQEQWKESVRADPELGGNRIETVLKTANSVIHQFGGSTEERGKLVQALKLTGAANHPEVVRFLYRIGKAREEAAPVPAPTPKSTPEPQSRASTRYKGNGAQA